MQFKYPEILYALLLLLIPIIVHLFQLRRFQKVAFTNVEFLKKVELQTRKSAKLKKFLILLSRLGLFTALILAFAQPYFSKNKSQLKPQTLVYIDNSLSMQAKNGKNELLKNTVQEIITSYTSNEPIHILTNNDSFKSESDKELKNQLLSLNYYPITQNLKTVLLKANKINPKRNGLKNHVVLISDFQSNNLNENIKLDSTTTYSFVQTLPQQQENIAIDSVSVIKKNGLDINLNVFLTNHNANLKNVTVSLFKENILIGKATINTPKNKKSIASFKIKFNDSFNGRISIEDNFIPFDNEFYFSINKPKRIQVLAIGKNNTFLSKIYTQTEFNYTSKNISQLDYNKISNQNLIVLNELKNIPVSLQKILSRYIQQGGSIAIIPAVKTNIDNYNQFLNLINIGSIDKKTTKEHLINSINFSHPILDNVFEKQVKNFQYPNVKSSYNAIFKNSNSILKFDNQQAFITQSKTGKGKLYWVASSLNTTNSNFKNSPLIVPVFYNFGKQSFHITKPYYTIGKTNKIDIKTRINKDEVLQIKGKTNFIPQQSVRQNKVHLITEENPLQAGFYQVTKGDVVLKNIAFNYNRDESETNYTNIKAQFKDNKNVVFSNNIKQTFQQISNQYKATSFWKWFIGLAILFWVIEMLLVKFMKKNR